MSKLAEQIIDFIEEYTGSNLPVNFGVIAGQSVAEAYFRIKNIDIHTRIKDIDLFVNITREEERYLSFIKKNSISHGVDIVNSKSSRVVKRKMQIDGSLAELNLNKTERYINNVSDYNINATYNLDMFNIIECSSSGQQRYFLQKTVNRFDINSIGIGICLKTKRLYLSYDFKDFLATRQVKIAHYLSVMPSICRFLEKSQYYQGSVYFDFVYEVNLLLPYFMLNQYKKNPYLKHIQIIQEKYDCLTPTNQKLLKRYFNVNPQSFYVFNNISTKDYCRLNSEEIIYDFVSNLLNTKASLYVFKIDVKSNKKITNIKDGLTFSQEEIKISNCLDKQLPHYFSSSVLYDCYTKSRGKPIKKHVRKKLTAILKYSSKEHFKDRDLILISSQKIKTVKFEPKIRQYNKTIKVNIRALSNAKFNIKTFSILLSYREILEQLYKSNFQILQDIQKYDKNTWNEYLVIIKLCLCYQRNDYKQFFKLKSRYIKTLIRYIKLTKNVLYMHIHKKISIDFYKLSQAIVGLEKSDTTIHLIGYFESNIIPIELIYNSCDSILEYSNQNILDESSDPVSINQKVLAFKDYKIKHIKNSYTLRRVGNEMKHCVYNQVYKLLKKQNIFFDVFTSKNHRYTLSVKLHTSSDGIKLYIQELKGYRNKMPYKYIANDMKEFIVRMNDETIF